MWGNHIVLFLLFVGLLTNWFEPLDAFVRRSEDLPEVCTRPKYVGRCKASFPRFYYNVETRTCESFIFGGCKSNGNNFLSEKDCLMTCKSVGGR